MKDGEEGIAPSMGYLSIWQAELDLAYIKEPISEYSMSNKLTYIVSKRKKKALENKN